MRYFGVFFFLFAFLVRILISHVNKTKSRKNTIEPFEFFDHFSHERIRVEKFSNNNIDSLLPSEKISILAKDFKSLQGNWCFKYKWKAKSSIDKISLFVEDWAKENNISFTKDSEFVIRICSPGWHYPKHYDCVNNRMFIIEGSRFAIIDGKEFNAKPGDMIFVPIGSMHEFWGDENNISIVVNIEDRPKNADTCEEKFDKDFKIQKFRANKIETIRKY